MSKLFLKISRLQQVNESQIQLQRYKYVLEASE